MKYYKVDIYLTSHRRKTYTVIFESEKQLTMFLEQLNSNNYVVMIGDLIFNKNLYDYSIIEEKEVKNGR